MNLTTQSALAKLIGISRQAISKAVTQGLIPHVVENGKKKIDLDDPGVQLYIKENSGQRERVKKKTDVDKLKDIVHPSEHDMIDKLTDKFPNIGKGMLEAAEKIKSKKKPSEKPAPKPAAKTKSSNIGKKNSTKSKSSSKITNENTGEIPTPSDLPELIPGDLSAFDLNQREKIAKVQLAEIKVEIMEKNNLPKDFIENGLFAYITKLNSNIERLMGIMIKDVGQSILQDKEVAPKHVDQMISKTLRLIDDTKKQIIKAIKKYEPKL